MIGFIKQIFIPKESESIREALNNLDNLDSILYNPIEQKEPTFDEKINAIIDEKFKKIEKELAKVYRQQARINSRIEDVYQLNCAIMDIRSKFNMNEKNISLINEECQREYSKIHNKIDKWINLGEKESSFLKEISRLDERIINLTNEMVTTKTIDVNITSIKREVDEIVMHSKQAEKSFRLAMNSFKESKDWINGIPNMLCQKMQAMENRLLEKGI